MADQGLGLERVLEAVRHALQHRLPPEECKAAVAEIRALLGQHDAAEPPELALKIFHQCRATGCDIKTCQLCELNPSRRCGREAKEKYLENDPLCAKCGAALAVALVDARTGLRCPLPEGVALEVHVLDGEAYGNPVQPLSAEQALRCVEMRRKPRAPTLPLIRLGDSVKQPLELIWDAQAHTASLGEVRLTTSTAAVANFNKGHCFRLLVVAVSRDAPAAEVRSSRGERIGDFRPPLAGISHAVSEPFVVATGRVKNDQKPAVPLLDDPVIRLHGVGRAVAERLERLQEELRPELERRGSGPAEVPSVKTVRDFQALLQGLHSNQVVEDAVRIVLGNMSPQQWKDTATHALGALECDTRRRMWWCCAEGYGVVFECRQGTVEWGKVAGVVAGGSPAVLHSLDALMSRPDWEQVRQRLEGIRGAARTDWDTRGHPNWSIWTPQAAAAAQAAAQAAAAGQAAAAVPLVAPAPAPAPVPSPAPPVPTPAPAPPAAAAAPVPPAPGRPLGGAGRGLQGVTVPSPFVPMPHLIASSRQAQQQQQQGPFGGNGGVAASPAIDKPSVAVPPHLQQPPQPPPQPQPVTAHLPPPQGPFVLPQLPLAPQQAPLAPQQAPASQQAPPPQQQQQQQHLHPAPVAYFTAMMNETASPAAAAGGGGAALHVATHALPPGAGEGEGGAPLGGPQGLGAPPQQQQAQQQDPAGGGAQQSGVGPLPVCGVSNPFLGGGSSVERALDALLQEQLAQPSLLPPSWIGPPLDPALDLDPGLHLGLSALGSDLVGHSWMQQPLSDLHGMATEPAKSAAQPGTAVGGGGEGAGAATHGVQVALLQAMPPGPGLGAPHTPQRQPQPSATMSPNALLDLEAALVGIEEPDLALPGARAPGAHVVRSPGAKTALTRRQEQQEVAALSGSFSNLHLCKRGKVGSGEDATAMCSAEGGPVSMLTDDLVPGPGRLASPPDSMAQAFAVNPTLHTLHATWMSIDSLPPLTF